MALDVTHIVSDYLAGNLGPVPTDPDRRERPDYGVGAALTDGVLEVVLTFRTGRAYCCYDWGCHLDLTGGKRWTRLRGRLAAAGIEPPPRLELRLDCVVEAGAEFFDMFRPDPRRRGWYAFAPASAYPYSVTASEGKEPA